MRPTACSAPRRSRSRLDCAAFSGRAARRSKPAATHPEGEPFQAASRLPNCCRSARTFTGPMPRVQLKTSQCRRSFNVLSLSIFLPTQRKRIAHSLEECQNTAGFHRVQRRSPGSKRTSISPLPISTARTTVLMAGNSISLSSITTR